MRLDKIMIWISIHLHSLAWSISPSVTTRSPTRSLLLPFRISRSYARYHTNALFVPLPLRRRSSRCRRNATRTDKQPGADRRDAVRSAAEDEREGDYGFPATARLMSQAYIRFVSLLFSSLSAHVRVTSLLRGKLEILAI